MGWKVTITAALDKRWYPARTWWMDFWKNMHRMLLPIMPLKCAVWSKILKIRIKWKSWHWIWMEMCYCPPADLKQLKSCICRIFKRHWGQKPARGIFKECCMGKIAWPWPGFPRLVTRKFLRSDISPRWWGLTGRLSLWWLSLPCWEWRSSFLWCFPVPILSIPLSSRWERWGRLPERLPKGISVFGWKRKMTMRSASCVM